MPPIEPTNLTAQLHHRAAGNPPSTLPDSAISNCFPGLEFDFRNIWRRLLEGIEVHEASGFVVSADAQHSALVDLYLLRVAGVPTRMAVTVPTADGAGQPAGLAFMEWSNAMADVVADHSGAIVRCEFSEDRDSEQPTQFADLRVRPLFARSAATGTSTALIDESVVLPGELTQSLCSPWQNDYQECGCFYWAASRPDYVNVDSAGADTQGSKWLGPRTDPKSYDDVPDYTHEQLFAGWEELLRFIVGGRDSQ